MSFIIPDGFTLQFSTANGDLSNQGVLSSNIQGSDVQQTFPTTSTGTSVGNYNHMGIDGQNNNIWDFLNISGTLDGGFNFWTSNSTQAPQLITNLSTTGLSVPDNASTNKSLLTSDSLYLESSSTFAPTVLSQTGLSLNNNTGNTNEILSTQITLNDTVNNLTNIINPQIVELSDNSGTTSNIQCDGMGFMVNDGTIYKTSTFSSQSLQIKNWITNNKILMTDNSITLNDYYNINTNVIDKNQISLSNNSNFDNVIISPDSVLVRNTNNNSHVSINNYSVGISNDGNSYSSGLTQTSLYFANNNPSYLQNIKIQQYPDISITSTDGTNTSILTPNNLTFNNIPYSQNQVVPTLIYSSPVIYADGHDPATSLNIRNNYGYSGWYYKNAPPNSAPTNKINWYFPPSKPNTTLVSDLKGIAISFFNGNTTSNDNTLFLTVLTIPTGNNDYAPNFYHSSMTYVFNQSITPVINTAYQGVCIVDKKNVPSNYETQIQYEQSTVNNPKGTYSQTDKILAVVIQTNSASPTNSVELVVNKLNLIYANFTQSYLLFPP